MVKIHVIAMSLGYVEEATLGTYWFGHTEGFDTVYDAVKDLNHWFLELYKKRTKESFFCFRKEFEDKKRPCPAKHPKYPYKFCHDCGKKIPSSLDPSHEEIKFFFTEEIKLGTADSWPSFESNISEDNCLWHEWVGLDDLVKMDPHSIAYFPEDPFPLFLLTSTGDEFGTGFKKETIENKKSSKFIDSKLDYNDESNIDSLIDKFEHFRL